jgi:hypothetical protein
VLAAHVSLFVIVIVTLAAIIHGKHSLKPHDPNNESHLKSEFLASVFEELLLFETFHLALLQMTAPRSNCPERVLHRRFCRRSHPRRLRPCARRNGPRVGGSDVRLNRSERGISHHLVRVVPDHLLAARAEAVVHRRLPHVVAELRVPHHQEERPRTRAITLSYESPEAPPMRSPPTPTTTSPTARRPPAVSLPRPAGTCRL